MIASKSHDIGASSANLFTRLTSSNYLEFVGAKFAYPSQEWCIKRLKMIPEKYEIFARFIEMIRDEVDAPFYLSKGLPLLSEQEIINLMNRLSKDNKFDVKLWSKTPIDISSIVLQSTVNVTEKFSVEIANISLEGVTKFIYDEKITPKMLKNTVENLPSIIVVASKLPENFEAEIFIFVIQQFMKIESIEFEYLSLAESICVRYRLPLNVCETEADKKKQRQADEIYSYIIRYRKICEISNCLEVFDNYFRGKKDPLSILVRTLFDDDLEQLSNDCLNAFPTSDVFNSGYLFVAMSFLLDKIPLKVSSYFDITVQYCTRDCKMSADLMMKCLSMNEYLVGENITKIVLTLKDIFRNIMTKSDALKLLKMIRQSQHLTQEQSVISAVPLVAFDLDDAFPVSIKPTPFAFSFLFDVMNSGCLSVKQMHRVLDFFTTYKSSIDDEMKENLFNELCTLMSVENTIETSLKLTNLLKLLST
ncbi:hypothetical protein TVAGG3_0049830 [Trichomonas vaginalis G3]|uniref:hypothetical protein n=1 Tax=Trichomonas vaginalis (strain ATCC PRA-98 / G3) TaxID=412133 RepID=UPI0021E5DEB6|nr:hypothetical protein TVAGG3_0049610 [Trichomonas vaginalis G3]XP_051105963.1 hypothetical protein TVAGG3_0049830 [Trichomonas vaginalis G3]KAI5541296.1 hypothetical protein TVAGG3_0049610 [Trichomonas vaginalis G3]KAI5541312.1 hypothetical protein TVAGG3_0049830 [Trichomonas vaginalis G3]